MIDQLAKLFSGGNGMADLGKALGLGTGGGFMGALQNPSSMSLLGLLQNAMQPQPQGSPMSQQIKKQMAESTPGVTPAFSQPAQNVASMSSSHPKGVQGNPMAARMQMNRALGSSPAAQISPFNNPGGSGARPMAVIGGPTITQTMAGALPPGIGVRKTPPLDPNGIEQMMRQFLQQREPANEFAPADGTPRLYPPNNFGPMPWSPKAS